MDITFLDMSLAFWFDVVVLFWLASFMGFVTTRSVVMRLLYKVIPVLFIAVLAVRIADELGVI